MTIAAFSAVGLFCVLTSAGVAQELSEDDLKFILWHAESQRTAICSDDTLDGSTQFSAPHWREGDSVVRGTMLRDLICLPTAYGLDRSEITDLLGPGDKSDTYVDEDDPLVYRVLRTSGFRKFEPPVPHGFRQIPHTYDVRVVFDPENGTVIVFEVFPAIERDS